MHIHHAIPKLSAFSVSSKNEKKKQILAFTGYVNAVV